MNQEKKVKQQILAVLVIFFMFIMVFSTIDDFSFVRAVADTTNLLQNIVSGELFVEAPTAIGFNDVAAGTGVNSLANLSVVNVIDNRGSSAGWGCVGGSSNFVNGASGNLIIPNSRLQWAPGDITGADLNGVAAGPDYSADFSTGSLTLMNAGSGYGSGAYNIANTTYNLMLQVSDYASNYNATFTFTLT